MPHRTILISGALLLGLPLLAQNARIHRDDADNDGTVTQQEWQGRMADFRALDRNRDGALTGNEIPGNRNRRSAGDRPSDGDRGTEAGKLDQNRTGVVEGNEWPYNPDVFHKLDTDSDSVLSPNELKNIQSVTLEELDRNKDGRLDQNEWPAGYAQFADLDQNKDGRIAASEYFQRGGEWQRRSRFRNWDTNNSGIIESTEWKSAPKLFHRLDTNGDSRVSLEEFMGDQQRYRPPYRWE
jgi:Ca2+-binding EF-hand superfamily protein